MGYDCPYCPLRSECPKSVIRFGQFYRTSDARWIQRYRCERCRKTFSAATNHPCFGQNKRQYNVKINGLLCSCVSQRRIARLLHLNVKTVVRKLLFLADQAESVLARMNQNAPLAALIQFDDLETFEHTKCKPLSVTLAVRSDRTILGFGVFQMPAKGLLAAISRAKYGWRRDDRAKGRRSLFETIKPFIDPHATIQSDQNPYYPPDLKIHFPHCTHEPYKGRRGCVVGQGELKKIGFDPLFSLNHTCAMLRANINRLVRRTWCTTKKPDRLRAHIAIYATYHNEHIKKQKMKTAS